MAVLKFLTGARNETYTLKIDIESPPLVVYGPPENSSGALLTGILDLYPHPPANATDTTFKIEKLEMKLVMEVATYGPIQLRCPACATRPKVIHTWLFIPSCSTLNYNNGAPRRFPFYFLFPGTLPATAQYSFATVSYKLVAEAIPVVPDFTISSSGPGQPLSRKQGSGFKPVVVSKPVKLSRSILSNTRPTISNFTFASTMFSSTLSAPKVIYHGTTNNAVYVTLSGFKINKPKHTKTLPDRWSLRKITWRIEEFAKIVVPACAAHSNRVGGAKRKGYLYEDTRIVGAGNVKTQWNYDESAGKIEAVLQVDAGPRAMTTCHDDAKSGIQVSHNLVINCVILRLRYHERGTNLYTGGAMYAPVGNPHVLRMSFPLIITERSGTGTPRDDEILPRYEDVAWNAPPTFAQSENSAHAELLEWIRQSNGGMF